MGNKTRSHKSGRNSALISLSLGSCFVALLWCLTSFENGVEAGDSDRRKLLHIGGIFPINGTGGWQGGQVWFFRLLINLQNQMRILMATWVWGDFKIILMSYVSVKACKPAADMALADVNKRRDLLPGYKLHLHWNDSEVIKLMPSVRLRSVEFWKFMYLSLFYSVNLD